MARNTARMEDLPIVPARVISRINRWFRLLFSCLPLPKSALSSSIAALRQLGLDGDRARPAKMQVVHWVRPIAGWIMIGSALGNPGPSGGGEIARDSSGSFMFAFASGYGIGSNGRAETKAIWEGLAFCIKRGFSKVEIVSNSKSTVDLIRNKASSSWALQYWLIRIRSLMDSIEHSISYSPRETNAVADGLARMGSDWMEKNNHGAADNIPRISSQSEQNEQPEFGFQPDYGGTLMI